MSGTPHFESEFLENLARAFRKRRKALIHGACRAAELAKVYELVNAEKTERLEMHIAMLGPRGAVLRLHAWPDRTIWLDARQSAKRGWAWSWTCDGRLVGEDAGHTTIQAFEETCNLAFRMESSRTKKFNEVWAPLLARGPIEVR